MTFKLEIGEAPTKKDTFIEWKECPETAGLNEPVTLVVRIYTNGVVKTGINGLPIYFYWNGNKLNSEPIYSEHCEGILSLEGCATGTFSFPSEGTYKLTAKFEDTTNETYKTSTTDVVKNLKIEKVVCDQGVIVTVDDVPEDGVFVQGARPAPLLGCKHESLYLGAFKKKVMPDNPIITYDKRLPLMERPAPGDKYCFRVIDEEGYILDYTKEKITIPNSSCKNITLKAWNGAHWYTILTYTPKPALIDQPFEVTATLKETPPDQPAGAGHTIHFYEDSLDGTPVHESLTDENGVAHFPTSKAIAGTYKYFAVLKDYHTYIDPPSGLSVTVQEKELTFWDEIIQFVMETFNVDEPTATKIAYGAIIGVGLLFLLGLTK